MVETAPGRATANHGDRLRSAQLFVATGLAAILAGGLVAAAIAHAPTRNLVWMVAYLVLVVGLAQTLFGAGQALLPARPPGRLLIGGEWLLFNFGNAGVIAGTLTAEVSIVAVATVLVLAALAMFALVVRDADRQRLRQGYHALVAIVAIGALVGLGLSVFSASG